MPKPAGASCNLRCEYCFYLEKQAVFAEDSPGQAQASQRMSDELLETYVRKYIESQPGRGEVAFMWQGGEPTLMGLEFFEKAVRLQDKYAADQRHAAGRWLGPVPARAEFSPGPKPGRPG